MLFFTVSGFWCSKNLVTVNASPIAENEITVIVDWDKVKFDVPPTIIEGRTMVPLRAIFEALEAQVEWNADKKTVTGTRENTNIKLVAGSKLAEVNGEEVLLDVPATIISGRTLVPARFISEAFGAKVSWDAKTREVTILTQDVISIPDANFEKAIRQNIKKYSGEIFSSDLKKIVFLEAGEKDISDIEGVQYMKNVKYLYLEKNSIRDISLLSDLYKLEKISLNQNRISDIRPLAQLTNLKVIYMHTNLIKDITPLKLLINLEELYIGGNSIKKIDTLSSLSKLETLYLGDNQITDMRPLASLKMLKELDIYANSTLDITPLKELKNLKEIYVEYYAEESVLNDELYEKYDTMQKKAREIVEKVIKPDMTDLEKELALHDYLVFNTTYDYENYLKDTVQEESHQPYGVLVNKVAVCDGFARTMQILLDMVGIENEFVHGYADGEMGWIGHAWNMVKIDGEYFHLDVTFNNIDKNGIDIVNDTITHTFFNLSDRQISIDHKWEKDSYPSCNTDSDYFTRKNEMKGDRIIDGDTAYYLDSDNKIVKLSLVDHTSSKLTQNSAEKIVLCDGFIYYISGAKARAIYKVKTDGTNEEVVFEGDVKYLKEDGGNIYFIDGDDRINTLNKSQAGIRKISNGSIASVLYFTEDFVIYKAYKWNIGGHLYRISKETEETERIISDMPSGFSFSEYTGYLTYYNTPLERVIDDWIYYVNADDGNSLYKVKADGTERTRLNYSESTIIDIIGDWLYYHNDSDRSKVYRVKTDGSENNKVQE